MIIDEEPAVAIEWCVFQLAKMGTETLQVRVRQLLIAKHQDQVLGPRLDDEVVVKTPTGTERVYITAIDYETADSRAANR